jgi:hypothetical protein
LATETSIYKGNECLPSVFLKVLKPVFTTLNETELLKRCVLGAIQNINESLNGLVWSRCHKRKHHGAKTVQCAVASGVIQLNCGGTNRAKIMAELSIPGDTLTKKASTVKNRKHVSQADLRATAKEKKMRQGENLFRTGREEALKDAEGTTYEASAF